MNGRPIRYAGVGLGILALLIALTWLALRETPAPPAEIPAKIPNMSAPVRVRPTTLPGEDTTQESGDFSADATPTNAAVIYRQAFALCDALSEEEKGLIKDWRTNVDAAEEAQLCKKLLPICNLMHQASLLTNCDWEFETPLTFATKLPEFGKCASVARAAIWSSAHCQEGEPIGAANDLIAAARLGQNLPSTHLGHLLDVIIQGMVINAVTAHATALSGASDTRLIQLFNGAEYEEGLRRAIEQEADMLDREANRMAELPAAEAARGLKELAEVDSRFQSTNSAQYIANWRQVAELERGYSKALGLSEVEYKDWLAGLQAVRKANPYAESFLYAIDTMIDRTQRLTIDTAMTQAGLAVAHSGPDALQSNLDPSTGKPFVYTQTDDGFELQSGFLVDGQPLRLRFK